MDKYNRVKMIGKGNCGDVWLVEDNKGQVLDEKTTIHRNLPLSQSICNFRLLTLQMKLHYSRYSNTLTQQNITTLSLKMINYVLQWNLLKIVSHFHQLRIDDLQIYTKSNPANIINWFTQLCQAVSYLHSINIVHKDIKMKNVFLTSDGIIKLGDFSISKRIDSSLNLTQQGIKFSQLGTPYYLSPEICESKTYNTKTDIWGLGCFLFELCTKQKPFKGESLPEVFNSIIHGETPQLPEGFPKYYQEIINSCLLKNPEERPDVQFLLEIPEIKKERAKFSQLYKQRLIKMLKQLDQVQIQPKQLQRPIYTPQNKPESFLFKNLFSEQIQSSIKKPMTKKLMSIDTEQIENENLQQQKQQQQFARQLFNPKTPTSPNRSLLLVDFLKNKLGEKKFFDIRQKLEESDNPLLLLERKDTMSDIIGEINLDCLKIFKILITNCVTPPGTHFRQINNYQFLRQNVNSQPDLEYLTKNTPRHSGNK